jgi:steroid 5-alpha reductase family enzyme
MAPPLNLPPCQHDDPAMTALALLLTGALGAALMMLVLWVIQLRTKNAAIVDAGWAGGLAGLAVFYAAASDGDPLRRTLVAAMGGLWGLRLALYLLFTRVIGQPEEGRYQHLRLGPALILYFLLRVTGIPATEAQALRSKGEAYRRYQETTSAFVPWPPRKDRP